MALEGQRLQTNRYQVVPRTLCFLLRDDCILLLKLDAERGSWGGKYNGVGGHIEIGEDPLSAARREIIEETGYSPESLRLTGTVMINTGGNPGIALYVFVGKVLDDKPPHQNPEGTLRWIRLSALEGQELVEDLPILIPKSLEAYQENHTYSARYSYDLDGCLSISFQN